MTPCNKASSLLTRVIWRVLPPASLLLLAIWYVASETTSSTVAQQVRERLDLAANESAAALSAKLGVLLEAAHGLAANDLIVNGIVDTQERDNYLAVLFQSLRVPGPDGAVITLSDYRGRPIISTGDSLPPHDQDWLRPVMAGDEFIEVTAQGVFIAVPVSYGGAPEGALIISYDSSRVPDVLHVVGGADATLVTDAKGEVLFSSRGAPGAAGGPAVFEDAGWVLAQVPVPGFPQLAVTSALDIASASVAVDAVHNIMLVTVLLSIGALGGGIVLAAYLSTRPLSDFIASIGEITHATDLRRRISTDGPAEFQKMAVSFNEMIERLERTTTSRDNFDNIVNSMLEMLIVTDPSGDVIYANRAAKTMFQLERRDDLKVNILDLFREDECEPGARRLAPRNVDRNSRSIEAVCNLDVDPPVHVLVTASRAVESDSASQNIIYVALDVTESKKAGDALYRAKRQLQTAIESISEAFALYDADDRLVLFNSKYLEVYRESAGDIAVGARFEDIIRAGAERGQYPEAIGRIEDFVKERVARHLNPSGPFEQQLPNGRWLRIEERFTNDGGIVGIRNDITELKEREAELRRQAEALGRSNSLLQREIALRSATEISLRDSETRARAVFETAADGVITVAPDGRIVSINPAAERIFGYAADELDGVSFKQCIAEAHHVQIDDHIACRGGEAKIDAVAGSSSELTGRRKSGASFPMELTISSVPLGERMEFTVIVRDISERKKIEKMKGEFVSTVSHELRTPVTAINGTIGLLRSGAAGALPEPAEKLINIASENCRRLINLINDILDIEKIASDGMQFEMRPLEIARLIEDAVEVNSGLAAGANVELVAEAPLPKVKVKGDFARLSQVLTNLISNAVKFSPEGGVVRVSAATQGARVRISVTDHGGGVPKDFHGRIFGRFSQADSSETRRSGGTGLGLAICKSIVEHHRGSIGFESEPNERTEFHFDLAIWDPKRIGEAAETEGAAS